MNNLKEKKTKKKKQGLNQDLYYLMMLQDYLCQVRK